MSINWRRNLLLVWVSQFIGLMGFAFAMPFAPYYIQELGVKDPVKLKLWVSVYAAAAPLTMAIFAPIWGAVADRYGRRVMLLRANFGAAFVLVAMGSVRSVTALVLLRLLQGSLTGTVSAAQTLVSVYTPVEKTGFALGTLSAAVFSGNMVGAFVGGIVADHFGYRSAFLIAGILLMAAGMMVLIGVEEQFLRPARTNVPKGQWLDLQFSQLRPALPILLLIMGMAFVRQFDSAMLPLLVQEIQGSIVGAATKSGTLSAIGGVAGLLAGVILGRLADRVSPPKIAKASALGAGLLEIPMATAHCFLALFAARFGMVFCAGGLDPVFQIWLAKSTPQDRRGTVFGWAVTVKSIGWVFAPLLSGAVASAFQIRAVFLVGGCCFFLLIPAIGLVARKLSGNPISGGLSCDNRGVTGS